MMMTTVMVLISRIRGKMGRVEVPEGQDWPLETSHVSVEDVFVPRKRMKGWNLDFYGQISIKIYFVKYQEKYTLAFFWHKPPLRDEERRSMLSYRPRSTTGNRSSTLGDGHWGWNLCPWSARCLLTSLGSQLPEAFACPPACKALRGHAAKDRPKIVCKACDAGWLNMKSEIHQKKLRLVPLTWTGRVLCDIVSLL